MDESVMKILQAIKAIKSKEGDKTGIAGTIDCPGCGCKDSLSYTISSYNGHIWGKCECGLGWMM